MGLKHQAASARKWRAAIRQVERHFPAHLPPLLFLTDPKRTRDPVAVISTLPEGSGVIYRHFGAYDRDLVARQLRDVCSKCEIRLLIASDPDLATHIGADGVHWPEAKLAEAQTWRRKFALQTSSAHSPAAIRRAARSGMDAVLFSAVFPSNSPSAPCPLGPQRFKAIAQGADLPLYALGGVTAENAEQVASHAGLAAIEGLIPS